MKRILLIFCLLAPTVTAFSQNDNDLFVQGYIFSEDSIPIENVYLINYRSERTFATNVNGFFRFSVHSDDSIMINHISLKPKVIYAKDMLEGAIKVYVPYRTYTLRAISTQEYKKNAESAKKNMDKTKQDMQKITIVKEYQRSAENPYDPDKQNPGVTVPILQLGKKDKDKPQKEQP
ncbi:MAG: hypothetical protein LBR06_06070 [Bacteroidales bacterium]|jgi:hypothetical protein|nr:hypothetical protein [Bacteroidales bacterium]